MTDAKSPSSKPAEFETRMLTGGDRQGGFMCYASAAEHARQRARATGKSYVVSEVTRRCIISPEDAKS